VGQNPESFPKPEIPGLIFMQIFQARGASTHEQPLGSFLPLSGKIRRAIPAPSNINQKLNQYYSGLHEGALA